MENKKTWLEDRRKSLGGSDSPTVLGINPYTTRTELWQDKLGLLPEQEPNNAMKRGTALEPIVAEIYQETTGRELKVNTEILRNKDLPYMHANIDREILGNGDPGVLEIKCPGIHIFGKVQREGPLDSYLIQLQHYLAVTGHRWGSLAVFNAERWELLFYDIDRDNDLINIIKVKDAEFWQLVKEKTQPEEIDQAEILDLPKVGDSNFVTITSKEWSKAIQRLQVAKDLASEAKALEEEAKASVIDIMNAEGAEIAEGNNARIYYKEQSGRVSIDTKKLKKDQPEIWEQYKKQGKSFRSFRFYNLKGGV